MPKKNRQATRTTPGFTGPFKGNPQQGTLFDVRTVPKTGDEIGPRGYSLNRSRQFNQIIGGIGAPPGSYERRQLVPFSSYGGVTTGQHPYTDVTGEGEAEVFTKRGRSKLIDTLARSTARPEDLSGLSQISVRPARPGIAGTYQRQQTINAEGRGHINLHVTKDTEEEGRDFEESLDAWKRGSFHSNFPERVKNPQQRGPVDPDAEITLLHELGHHVSNRQGNESAVAYAGKNQAIEEGRADRYAMDTWRQDPREYRWKHPMDPREHTYGARGIIPGLGAYDRHYWNFGMGIPKRDWSPERYDANSLANEAGEERRQRPMLDESHFQEKEQRALEFNDSSEQPPSPFSPTNVPGWTQPHEPENEHRMAIYKTAVQRKNQKNRVFQTRQATLKARWGVTNRRQFGGY